MSKRTRSDYLLEAHHLIDEIEHASDIASPEKYISLVEDMQHKTDKLWCFMLELRSCITQLKKEVPGIEEDGNYRLLNAILDKLARETYWEEFKAELVTCPRCGGEVEIVHANEPYSPEYIQCVKCDSTFIPGNKYDQK